MVERAPLEPAAAPMWSAGPVLELGPVPVPSKLVDQRPIHSSTNARFIDEVEWNVATQGPKGSSIPASRFKPNQLLIS